MALSMKKPVSRTESSEPDHDDKVIASFDEAIDHCANIAAVATLLQGREVRSLCSVLGEDPVAASARLVAQKAEKLHHSIQRLRSPRSKTSR